MNRSSRAVETAFPMACGKVIREEPGHLTMGPDTPANIPGNGQYFFLTKVLPHDRDLVLRIEWPQGNTTQLPGFHYPDNENFGTVLAQSCYTSRDLRTWEACPHPRQAGGGIELLLAPAKEPLFVSIGIPYTIDRLEKLLSDMEATDNCVVKEFGKSRLGRVLYGFLVRPKGRVKGLFLLQGYQHHTEWAGLHALDRLLRGLAGNEYPVAGYAWAIVPCVNVDALYGGWREDMLHTDTGTDGKSGNLNRDWEDFAYPETRAARDFYCALSRDYPVLHGLDFHMGWSTPQKSGAGLTIFKEGQLPGELAMREGAFTDLFFQKVPIEPFAWQVTTGDRPNFASWVWRTFGVIGQTFEISRFRAFDETGTTRVPSRAYYEGLGPRAAACLVDFYNRYGGVGKRPELT